MQTGQLLNPAMCAHNLDSAIPTEVAYCVDASARGRLSLRQSWEDIRNSEAGESRSTGLVSGVIRRGRGAGHFAGDSLSANLTTSPRRMREDDPGQVRVPTEAVAIVPLMDRATTPPVIAPPTDVRNGTWPGPLRLNRPHSTPRRIGLSLDKWPVLPFLEPEPVTISGVEVPGLRTSVSAIGPPVHPKSLSLQLFPRRRVVVAVTRRSGRSREHASGVLS